MLSVPYSHMADSHPAMADKRVVTSLYYGSEAPLQIRVETWKRYGTNPQPLVAWIADQVTAALVPGTAFLDVGCGTGDLLAWVAERYPAVRLSGLDMSPAMVQASTARVRTAAVVSGNAERLPFPDGSFGIVTAIHMLYHVPDIAAAVREFFRVLTPGGVLFLTTSDFNLQGGMNRVHYEALEHLHMPAFLQDKAAYLRFPPEAAETLVRSVFPEVRVCLYRNDLVFTETAPFLRYYRTAMKYRNSTGPEDPRVPPAQWELLEREVARRIGGQIAADGKFVSESTVTGIWAQKQP